MARKTTSMPGSATSQSSATIGFEASDLGVIHILENRARTLDTLLPKLLSGAELETIA